MSPTYSTLRKVGMSLELTIAELVAATATETHPDFEVVRSTEDTAGQNADSNYRLLAGAHASEAVRCFVSEVRSLSANVEDYHTHRTADIVFVLEGSINFHFEGQMPTTLHAGDSLYYRGETPHTFTWHTEGLAEADRNRDNPPKALWISMKTDFES